MDVYIVGTGMTNFGRFPDLSVKDLARKAVHDALSDAACDIPSVNAVFFANSVMGYLENQVFIPGPIAMRTMGFQGIPILTVENACASGSTALWEAVNYVRSGAGDIALAVGVEKMNVGPKERQLAVFDSGWEYATADENFARLQVNSAQVAIPPGHESDGRPHSRFMDIYASWARDHMSTYGVTQRQLAAVASKNHANSVHNERAYFRKPFSVEEILAARTVAYPLTVPMCAPVTDGGAAAVICNESALGRLGVDRRRAVKIAACILTTGVERAPDNLDLQPTCIAAQRAFETAGIGPDDVDVAEVHDASAIGEVREIENLGLCPRGDGAALTERGETALTGRIPVNPSGGLESKGHPIAATGLGQIFELVSQLRGEAGARQVQDSRTALQENGGGLIDLDAAVTVVSVLVR